MKKKTIIFSLLTATLVLGACGGKKEANSGTFEGTGSGKHGDIKVAVTLKDGAIKDIKVKKDGENQKRWRK